MRKNSGYWGAEHLKKIKIGSFLVFNCLKTFLFEKKTISLQRYIYILVIERNKQKQKLRIIYHNKSTRDLNTLQLKATLSEGHERLD